MKYARHYHSSVILEDMFLYVFGGHDSVNNLTLSSIEMLNLDKSELHWVTLDIVNKNGDWTA